jgi:hypothetical protein
MLIDKFWWMLKNAEFFQSIAEKMRKNRINLEKLGF